LLVLRHYCCRHNGVGSIFILWWVDFLDLTAIDFVLHQKSKLLNTFEAITRSLSILKLAANVSVAISEEFLFTLLVHWEDLDVDLAQAFAFMAHFQFAESFINHDLKASWVVSLELLLANCSDLNHQIHVLKLLGQSDSLGSKLLQVFFDCSCWPDFNYLLVVWGHVRELFSVILQEGSTREKDFSINLVVLDCNLLDIDWLQS